MMRRSAWFGLSSLTIALTSATAQSTLIGTVSTDSAGKHPLVGVEVMMPSAHKSARTDSSGTYRIDGLAIGHYTVLVRALGYQPSVDSIAIDVADGTLHNVVLSALAQPLDTVRSKSRKVEYISPALRAFEERRRAGFGHFLSDSVLRQFENQSLSQLTRRLPGTMLIRSRNQTYLASTRKSIFTADGSLSAARGSGPPSRCFATVYFDGILIYDQKTSKTAPPNLDDYVVSELAGIEYYGGEAAPPPQFRQSGCGLLLLWTRER
jgi:hypothetical protein